MRVLDSPVPSARYHGTQFFFQKQDFCKNGQKFHRNTYQSFWLAPVHFFSFFQLFCPGYNWIDDYL